MAAAHTNVVMPQAMLAEHPLLIIGVPCFNEAPYLKRALASVARQTWWDFKVLISDNASTDGSGDIARAFCEQDNRFVYHEQSSNIGSGRNFNFILEHSSSRYIFWMGAHDLIEPTLVEYHLRTLEARPELSVSQSANAWVDTNDQFVERAEDGELDGGPANDPQRYLRSIGQNLNNIGANSIIRRDMLDDVRFTDVVGTDRIILSHLAYRGPYATSDDVLYLRRTFAQRAAYNPYMERLTGRANQKEDWSAFACEYDEDFAGLLGDRPDADRLRRQLALTLRYYLPVERGSVLTTLLWTIRRVRKLGSRLLKAAASRGHSG